MQSVLVRSLDVHPLHVGGEVMRQKTFVSSEQQREKRKECKESNGTSKYIATYMITYLLGFFAFLLLNS